MKKFHIVLIVVWLVVFILVILPVTEPPPPSYWSGMIWLAFLIYSFFAIVLNGIITGFNIDKKEKKLIRIPLLIHIISFSFISVVLTGFDIFHEEELYWYEMILRYFVFLYLSSSLMILSTYTGYFIRKYLFKS